MIPPLVFAAIGQLTKAEMPWLEDGEMMMVREADGSMKAYAWPARSWPGSWFGVLVVVEEAP